MSEIDRNKSTSYYPSGPLTSRFPKSCLSGALTDQPWETIGLLPDEHVSSTSDLDVMVEQLSSVLEYRLAEVVKERKGRAARQGPGEDGPGRPRGQVQRRSSLGSCCSAASASSWGSSSTSGAGCNVSTTTTTAGSGSKLRRRHSTSSADVIYVSPVCRSELRDYVRAIGHKYRECRYHRFEHAAHVTLSANKLLDLLDERDVHPDEYDDEPYAYGGNTCGNNRESSSSIELDHRFQRELRRLSMQSRRSSCASSATANSSGHRTDAAVDDADSHLRREDQDLLADDAHRLDHEEDDDDFSEPPRRPRSSTFGIANDPLTKFCLVYAALVHDVDHEGVPNRQLSRENSPLALLYNDRSVAEQNSLKVAFSVLMEPRYAELRHTLCPTSGDQFAFRRIVIDLVMCTDIASPERMQIAKSKWAEAFGSRSSNPYPRGPSRGDACGSSAAGGYVPRSVGGSSGGGGGGGGSGNGNGSDSGGGRDAVATVTASRPRVVSLRRNSVGASPTLHSTGRDGRYGRDRLGIKRALHLDGSTVEFYADPNGGDGGADGNEAQEVRLRASTVLEVMMNAADVAHTLQGWDNFLKWNRRLYEELYVAYVSGRCAEGTEDDPSVGWFGNQLGFYDIYILPLARKLRKCGVFGEEMGETFVRNAKAIRSRWEYEGAAVTDDMVESVRREYEEFRRRAEMGDMGDSPPPLIAAAPPSSSVDGTDRVEASSRPARLSPVTTEAI